MKFDIIIVGAGLSGSYLAKKVHELGLNVLIIEKSKGIGGRFSTKPVGKGIADYGCQYLRPKTKELSDLIHVLKDKNLIRNSNILNDDKTFIAPYGMNKIPQYLSLGVNTLLNQKVSFIKKKSAHWEVSTDFFLLKSKILVLTMPIKQVSELLKVSDMIINDLPTAKYKSFHTITLQSIDHISSEAVSKNNFSPWICNNHLKGLSTDQNIFTINVNEELSNVLLNIGNDKKNEILKSCLRNSGFNNYYSYSLHYWKYAFTENQENPINYFDDKNMFGICGDSFSIGQANGAIVSAQNTFEILNKIL